MKNVVLVILLVPLVLSAQERGVSFLHDTEWSDIFKKAKAERKYIFVDCYASWCGPCKKMDKEVYVNDTIGNILNEKFLSVKIQMDSGIHDGPEVRKWHGIAGDLANHYKIDAYPCFLFFSPDGQIINKDVGEKNVDDFINMVKASLDPNLQSYTSILNYKISDRNYLLEGDLAIKAYELGLDSIGKSLAKDFINEYLEILPERELWTKSNVNFIDVFLMLIKSEDRIFRLFYKDRVTIDSVMNEGGYADRPIMYVIYNQDIKPVLDSAINSNVEPGWVNIRRAIERKYTHFEVQKDILYGRTRFYFKTGQWDKYVNYVIRLAEHVGIEHFDISTNRNANLLNSYAFEVFKFSESKRELKKALSWANRAIAMNFGPTSEIMDTKANILYKLGRVTQALALEESSARLAPEAEDIQLNLKKMRIGEPTWRIY